MLDKATKFSVRILPSSGRLAGLESTVIQCLFLLVLGSLAWQAYQVNVGAVVFLYIGAIASVLLSLALELYAGFEN